MTCLCHEYYLAPPDFPKIPLIPIGKNNLIMNNPDLILRKSIFTKNDTITQHK
jgi:hypothetical protein